MSRFPFTPFPNGWFVVAYSDEVAQGEVSPCTYFGRELVIFRGEDGEAHVLDAYCPHLGAHLGIGGKVVENSIECPFHAWRFDGAGSCVAVPYAKRIPPTARVRAWPTLERNGRIMVWYHADGREPEFDIPVLPEVEDDAWSEGERRRWKIRSHNQEMAENSVDCAHFRYVHGTLSVPETEAKENGPVLEVMSKTKFGTPKGEMEGSISSAMHGFGFNWVRFTGIVETFLVSGITPIDGEYVDVRFEFRVKKLGNADATKGVGAALIRDIEKQMAEDTPIWENKVFHERPALCDGDGPIAVFRRWCQQFYSEPDSGQSGRAA
ncbi:MAG: aromatic ring-hydroxylating dioxygenase subunit alpha [Proteobacteria bacterium]|nr:aromatic ring-hydroxylating dioxygenase subunit alpha [Pseudomonadota bacterium]